MKRNLLVPALSMFLLGTAFSWGAGAAVAGDSLAGSAERVRTAPAVPWPSIVQQLQRDHVKPGSALERLIRDNQDFSILPAVCEEGEEGGDLPPWLRVLFHRNHPEVAAAGQCPEGGYPEFLSRIYTWMLANQNLVPAKSLRPTAPLSVKLGTGSNRRISGSSGDARSESDIRINPWNPSRIVAASNDLYSGASAQAQLYSLDGGSTWGQSSLSLQSGDSFQGDPAVDWTSDGTAWSTTLGISASVTSSRLQLYKSINGGATWTWDSTVPGTETGLTDKDMLWVDHSDSSPYKNNLYAIWTGTSGVHSFVSRKNGPTGTWSPAVEVTTDFLIGGTNGTDIKSNGYGDVFAFYPRFSDRKLLLAKSTNGGLSFSAPAIISSTFAGQAVAVPAELSPQHYGTITYISAAAYRTGTKNQVYLVWRDLSGETGCTSPSNAPGTNVSSSCKTRVWFTRSTDGGTSWEASRMLNNQASLNDQFNPHLALDDVTGTLGVVYYDTVADPGRKRTDLWYQSSYDNGVTWNPPVKITTASSDETPGTSNTYQYGDYNGLSGYNGTFFPSWTDSRNGIEEIWTAPVLDADRPPTASFTYNCTGLSCAFNAAGSTDDHGIVSYAWTFGDSSAGAGVSPTHVYGSSGSYPVTLTVTDTAGNTASVTQNAILIFADVPPGYWARSFIEGIYFAGITSGCGLNPRIYCPETNMNRSDTAVFLIKAKGPAGYVPPACTTPRFGDVPCSSPAAPYIDEFANRGITAGCGGGNYCPADTVTRSTMAYYLLATLGIPAPTSCTGRFTDVPCTVWYAPWVEELTRRGITSGCSPTTFCPDGLVTRAQMAVFLVQTFGIPH